MQGAAAVTVFPLTLKYGTLRFIRELGQGGQGMVGEYRDDEEKKSYAVKIDKQKMFTQGALAEGRFLANVGKHLTRAPKYVEHLSQDYVYYVIMQMLEKTAEEYLQEKKIQKKFDEAIKDIAKQMLEAIEELHRAKHIHRDIKPSNFMMLKDRLYITDFGMQQKYVTDDGSHITEQTCLGFSGSPYYASLSTHNGNSHSRRDDLMMLGFSLLHLIVGDGSLWFTNYQDEQNGAKIQQIIHRHKVNFLHDAPPNLKLQSVHKFLQQVEKLKFDEEPNYQLYQKLFEEDITGEQAQEELINQAVAVLIKATASKLVEYEWNQALINFKKRQSESIKRKEDELAVEKRKNLELGAALKAQKEAQDAKEKEIQEGERLLAEERKYFKEKQRLFDLDQEKKMKENELLCKKLSDREDELGKKESAIKNDKLKFELERNQIIQDIGAMLTDEQWNEVLQPSQFSGSSKHNQYHQGAGWAPEPQPQEQLLNKSQLMRAWNIACTNYSQIASLKQYIESLETEKQATEMKIQELQKAFKIQNQQNDANRAQQARTKNSGQLVQPNQGESQSWFKSIIKAGADYIAQIDELKKDLQRSYDSNKILIGKLQQKEKDLEQFKVVQQKLNSEVEGLQTKLTSCKETYQLANKKHLEEKDQLIATIGRRDAEIQKYISQINYLKKSQQMNLMTEKEKEYRMGQQVLKMEQLRQHNLMLEGISHNYDDHLQTQNNSSALMEQAQPNQYQLENEASLNIQSIKNNEIGEIKAENANPIDLSGQGVSAQAEIAAQNGRHQSSSEAKNRNSADAEESDIAIVIEEQKDEQSHYQEECDVSDTGFNDIGNTVKRTKSIVAKTKNEKNQPQNVDMVDIIKNPRLGSSGRAASAQKQEGASKDGNPHSSKGNQVPTGQGQKLQQKKSGGWSLIPRAFK